MKKVIIALIVGIIVLGLGIGFYIYNSRYIINYKGTENGMDTHVIIITNSKIKIKSTCTERSCDKDKEVKYQLFSKENITKLKKYLKENFKSNHIEVKSLDITNRQKEVIESLLKNEKNFEVAIEDFEYRLRYNEGKNISFYVYFKKDNSILVKKVKWGKNYNVSDISEIYQIEFNKKNTQILKDYIESEAKPGMKYLEGAINKADSSARKDEKAIFKSIVEKDEKYLDKKVKRIATMYVATKCDFASLYLYDDNTYEYEDIIDNKFGFRTGTYKYDINKIFKSLKKGEDGYYHVIDEKGNSYSTNHSKELNAFLNQVNIKLGKCLN